MPSNKYDISNAFKRIENDLMESMMRNLKRHQVEENKEGLTWEQWQVLQLQELEQYRQRNAKLFTDDFKQIDRKVDALFRGTAKNAQAEEEHELLGKIKSKQFTPDVDKGGFFRLNEPKLNALIMATQADFVRAEYAMLRRANDQYRQIIFDAMTYANVTNDYKKAVDMATHDFLKRGIDSVVYKNGARHTVPDYARMALRTGNKRAYLMGEGNAHDRYGLHTVRVNKRQDACPKCVGFLGKLLIDDVYGGGTRAEATAQGIPTLSDAMQAGFLHPNCKDMYSVYIDGVSKPAKPWTQEEIEDIVGEYNQEQQIQHAQDMQATYQRMAKFSLDPENQAQYQTRADNWGKRIEELKTEPPKPAIVPPVLPTEPPQGVVPFTEGEKDALEYYVSGDGMYLNNYLRGIGDIQLDATEQELLNNLTTATNRPLENVDKLYRSVDASVIFSDLDENELYNMTQHILYGDSQYDKGAYSQGIKRRMEQALNKAKGKTLTEKGFMSTTVDKQVAVDWGGFTGAENPVVLELDTKGKALKGANLDFLDVADDPQRERLLAKNTRYKINDIGVATDADGVKYIRVQAEIVDQLEDVAEQVAEEVVEQIAPPAPNTEEVAIRQRIKDIKSRNVDKLLSEAETEKERLKDAYNTYEAVKIGAQISGRDLGELLLEKADMAHADFVRTGREFYAEFEKDYRYIYDNLQAFEDGTYTDKISARIKDLKKQARTVQKELDKEYNALEAIIGEPNVSRLAVYTEKHTTKIKHFLDDTSAEFRNAWNKCADKFNPLPNKTAWGKRRSASDAYYNSREDGVWLSINKVAKGDELNPPYETVFHEYGHNIDYVLNRIYGDGNTQLAFSTTYKDGIFGKTVKQEAENAIIEFGKQNGFLTIDAQGVEIFDRRGAEKAFCKHIKENYDMATRGNLSDMFESVTENAYPFGAGHGKGYWTKEGYQNVYRKHGKEAFAEMYASNIANDASWELIKQYFPQSVEIFNEMINVVKL